MDSKTVRKKKSVVLSIEKLKKPEISFNFDKTLVLSIICDISIICN